MERSAMKELLAWKTKKNRKPLILWGARQVGKTWLMKAFAEGCFKNSVYVSFYNNQRISRIFDRDYDPKRIIKALEIELSVTIVPEETLLIFDEVQQAPKVVEALKYFCEEAPEYPVIAAGSLLGVALHEGISFPVGKVNEVHLYPMSFTEFLTAVGEEDLAEYTKDYASPYLADFHDRYSELLSLYLCIGGVPEVVQTYLDTTELSAVREVQLSILSQYEGDFGKHIKANELPRIRMVWNSIPMQLAKENRKFFFGQIKKGARQKDFEMAIEWLVDAGLIYRVHKVTKPGMPLKSYVDFTAFKLFFIDVGLLGALSELDMQSVLRENRIFTEYKGALAEQFVLQELICAQRYTPYYYAGEKSTYETDFLIQKGSDIVPIEVKAEDNLRSKSLRAFCEKFSPKNAYRISRADYRKQDYMENISFWGMNGI